jgi:hypothetical protein
MKRLLISTTLVVALGALPQASRAGTLNTSVIGMFPKNVGEFAYADLKQARGFSWFSQLKEQMLPQRFRQFEQFLAAAGIDPNVQVDEVAWALVAGGVPTDDPNTNAVPTSEQVIGVALGSFQPESAEAFFQAQKLPVEKVRTYALYAFGGGSGSGDLFFTFIDSNTAAFGQRAMLEKLIGVRHGDEQGLLANDELMPLITAANGGGVVWSVMTAAYTRLALQQITPELAQFPQARELAARVRALTISMNAGRNVDTHFQAVCATPDDANTFAALMQAGILYRQYQSGNSNPELSALLDQVRIAPSGDRLDIRLSLTNDQVAALIRRNTFVIKL